MKAVKARFLFSVAAALAATVASLALGLGRASAGTIGNGIVVIDTTLGYQSSNAAGTGMVLTSSGEILTNNHVIDGATKIKVVVPGTGRSYSAKVVGYDVKDDVALLKLSGASNLRTISVGSSSSLRVGQSVTAIGNAGGTGSLTSVTGTITGLRKSIVASDAEGNSEQLTGLIETDAAVVAGDSGGPLETASGKVIGMTTAASPSNGFSFRTVSSSDAYAIPIAKALSVVDTVRSGKTTARVHVGGTAFLGVSVTTTDTAGYYGSGVVIAGVAGGSPAAKAGLQEGDVIVSVGGTTITSPAQLRSLILTKHPGEKLAISYDDPYGSSGTVTVTLASGPPQ